MTENSPQPAKFGRADPFKPSQLMGVLSFISHVILAFIAVLLLAMSIMGLRVANSWTNQLVKTATIRISADESQLDSIREDVFAIIRTTPGIDFGREIAIEDRVELLKHWLSEESAALDLPLPVLIQVSLSDEVELDKEALRLRLAGTVPQAYYDDHYEWRSPLLNSAISLRIISLFGLLGILFAMTVMIFFAARTALLSNRTEIELLRLLGAYDALIEGGFVQKLTKIAGYGAVFGALLGALLWRVMPDLAPNESFLDTLRLKEFDYLYIVLIPLLSTILARKSAQIACRRILLRLE